MLQLRRRCTLAAIISIFPELFWVVWTQSRPWHIRFTTLRLMSSWMSLSLLLSSCWKENFQLICFSRPATRYGVYGDGDVVYRVERLNLRRRDSRAKLAGAIFCCAGATVMTLYNGPRLLLGAVEPFHIGAACLIGSGLCMATFINLQVLTDLIFIHF